MAVPAFQQNLDTFKETFQKPCQIYKFLREYWKKNPLYLHRTLSYIRKHRLTTGENRKGRKPLCYFNWICDDASRTSQKTKSSGFICPWCEKDCGRLNLLMIHLRSSHQRFIFHLVRDDGQPIVEMTLNKNFDGSYEGFKYPGHDWRYDFRFTPDQPERRLPQTQIIFFKARGRHAIKLENNHLASSQINGIDGDNDEVDVDVSGRLYYHTSTCLPVKANELDIDSEADIDPDWLRERTQLMIEEFTDVNEGEKEILKLWNLHIMKNYKYKGDNMMRQACLDFVESEGQTILSKNLRMNFTLHLANLYDYGLLSSGDILECTRMLKKLKIASIHSTVKSTKTKLERNEHRQLSPPAKRALLNCEINK